jgi:hypothetical protein
MATNDPVTGWHRSDRGKVVILGLVEESAGRAARQGWIVEDLQYRRAHEALASCRVQIHCMAMGQEVGTCAALSLEGATGLAEVETGRLQVALKADGVHLEDVPA